MGIFRPIRKEPGTSLVTYEAQMKDEALQGGASVGEGEAIPFTQFKVVESKKEDIVVEKYAKSLTLESVANGAQRLQSKRQMMPLWLSCRTRF